MPFDLENLKKISIGNFILKLIFFILKIIIFSSISIQIVIPTTNF